MTELTTIALQKELNAALEKGWTEFLASSEYQLTREYFLELAAAGFFEKKFRGKIANPAHDHAVEVMAAHTGLVFARHGLTLTDPYPGDFHTSTGEEITSDPTIPLYEHRNFHNALWKNGRPFADITITICHIRGHFTFPKPPFVTIQAPSLQYAEKFSSGAAAAQPNSIDALLKTITAKPDIISFAVGTPDTALLPVELLASLNERAIADYGRNILQYGLPKGFPPLVEAVQPILKTRGMTATPETIHISTGGSGALNNACMALLNPGDIVLVEDPTYSPAVKTFKAYGAIVVPVAGDEQGMQPEALAAALAAHQVKLVYFLPTFQNPTGRTMSLQRRKRLAAILQRANVLAIEDDVYYDLRYRGQDAPALQTFAPEHVLYFGSVSKIFAPAMRVGFAVIPQPLLAKFLILKHSIDMTTSPYTQALTAAFLKSPDFAVHVKLLKKVYGAKLTAMLEALTAHMPSGFTWNKPAGGLFLWVTGPADFDAEAMLEKAIAAGVAYMPGNSFYVDTSQGRNTMRLCFAHPSIEKIVQGIAVLAELCRDATNA